LDRTKKRGHAVQLRYDTMGRIKVICIPFEEEIDLKPIIDEVESKLDYFIDTMEISQTLYDALTEDSETD